MYFKSYYSTLFYILILQKTVPPSQRQYESSSESEEESCWSDDEQYDAEATIDCDSIECDEGAWRSRFVGSLAPYKDDDGQWVQVGISSDVIHARMQVHTRCYMGFI